MDSHLRGNDGLNLLTGNKKIFSEINNNPRSVAHRPEAVCLH